MYVVACPRFRARYEHTNCQNRARSRNSWPSGLHTIAFPFRVGRMEVCYLLSELMNYPYARGTRPDAEWTEIRSCASMEILYTVCSNSVVQRFRCELLYHTT